MDRLKILVPTDFSESAHNALDYAIGFAGDMNAEIILMHSIIYNDSGFMSASSKEEENTRRYNYAKYQLDKESAYVTSLNEEIPV